MPGGMESFDRGLGFEGDVLHLPPSIPSYDLYGTTFEDPFSYPAADFALLEDPSSNSHHRPHNEPSSTPVDLDNKLLGFGAPILHATILDDAGQTWPAMSAELYGMFFVAEDVFGDNSMSGRPMELTCYRRNLFQISGILVLRRSIKGVLGEQGQLVPAFGLMATLSALESIDGKATEIISVPWKSTSASSPEEKAGAAPPKWPLDLAMNPELDPNLVSIPIAWKRLQFKHATANNGRRKGLQQHYVIQINLVATLLNGNTLKLAEIQSGPIIVRGRSPRNFDSRKDVSLSERRVDPNPRKTSGTAPSQIKIDPGLASNSYQSFALVSQPLDLPDRAQSTPVPTPHPSMGSSDLSRPSKRPTLSHQPPSSSTPCPPVPKTRWQSDNLPTSLHKKSSSVSAPIDLSLADDEHGRVGPASPSLERDRGMVRKSASVVIGSPAENADLLYEYFPLSLDDWMPPVDAIYRPHVVHHTIVPPDLKAEQVKNRTKRYFSADD
ncbi:hypothetical protein B2J93_4548 [Marssonina coronariae]|uniref:NDT80 domain-containing protein n=1 Tax=Diplocarpon coronariae TaxID=2795749 RepID=A0A218Z8G9_9HELO|nr:hypothetical protein B2J93_4548 [Marssonina coronariae]